MTADREQFEIYAANQGLRDFERNEFDDYRNPFTQQPWCFWRASRDALAQSPAEGDEPTCFGAGDVVRIRDCALAVFHGCGQEARDVIEWYHSSVLVEVGVMASVPNVQPKSTEAGNWVNADDIDALTKRLDSVLNGPRGAESPKLCDIVAQLEDARVEVIDRRDLFDLVRGAYFEGGNTDDADTAEVHAQAHHYAEKTLVKLFVSNPCHSQAPGAEDYKQAPGSKNCMQSAVAYMLGLPMDAVPDFEKAGPDAWESFYAFFSERGFTAEMFPPNVEIDGDYLASGSTERGTSHMVVMRGGKLLHDPHPSNAGLTSPQVVWVIARKAGPSPAVGDGQ